MKKVLLIIIDALASRVISPALEQGLLPNMGKLAQAGLCVSESVAVFPSITPAATASMITGSYPHDHGIAGAYWYIPDEKKVVYYSDDFWVILRQGLGNMLEDFVVKLNQERLRADTLFQTLETAGLKTASLNFFMFHGNVSHQVNAPLLLKLLAGNGFTSTLDGPTTLYLGDLVQESRDEHQPTVDVSGGIFHRFGFDDVTTAKILLDLVEQDGLPHFTVAYFPDNDFDSHKLGPEAALETVQKVDTVLGKVITAYGGLETMLAETSILITGDHAQSEVLDDDSAGIILDELLTELAIAPAGRPLTDKDDLVICPNLRTAQIYFHQPNRAMLESVLAQLMADSRIDQAMWTIETFETGISGFQVMKQEGATLRFWPGNSGDNTAFDCYGGAWSWQGDLSAVDGAISAEGLLTFGEYPNAFERIATGLSLDCGGHLWLTAKPGYEFVVSNLSLHQGGGSHGSLHVLDSMVPIIAAGLPANIAKQLPQQPRSVDLMPLCQAILGVKSHRKMGESHFRVDSE